MLKFVSSLVLSAVLVSAPMFNAHAADALKATPIIFEAEHMLNTNLGDELVYDFARTASDEAQVGKAFKDKITMKVSEVKDGKRTLDLQIYTGERAREQQKMTDMSINPMFIVTMQQAVSSFRMMGGGDLPYLKDRFTKSIDKKAVVEGVKIDYKGQTVDAYRINVLPFKDDPNVSRMKGYEASTFTFIISKAVPGELVEAVSTIKSSAAGTATFEERTTLAGFGGVK